MSASANGMIKKARAAGLTLDLPSLNSTTRSYCLMMRTDIVRPISATTTTTMIASKTAMAQTRRVEGRDDHRGRAHAGLALEQSYSPKAEAKPLPVLLRSRFASFVARLP